MKFIILFSLFSFFNPNNSPQAHTEEVIKTAEEQLPVVVTVCMVVRGTRICVIARTNSSLKKQLAKEGIGDDLVGTVTPEGLYVKVSGFKNWINNQELVIGPGQTFNKNTNFKAGKYTVRDGILTIPLEEKK